MSAAPPKAYSTDCQNAVQETAAAWGGVDILFNNAGIIRRATLVELSEEDWDRVMAVNIKSMFLRCCILPARRPRSSPARSWLPKAYSVDGGGLAD